MNGWFLMASLKPVWNEAYFFRTESEIRQAVATPVLVDSMSEMVVPMANHPPPKDLFYGPICEGDVGVNYGGGSLELILPRHGGRPSPTLRSWPASQPLPGAVNIAMFDGHTQLAPLEQLWQLYWHPNYQPPAKRPGLE